MCVVDNNQESSRYLCPAVTDEAEAESRSEGTATDETHVLLRSLGLGVDWGFSPLTLLLSVSYLVLLVSVIRFCWCQLSGSVGVSYLVLLVSVIWFCWCQLSGSVGVSYLVLLVLVIRFCWCQLSGSVGVSYLVLLVSVIWFCWWEATALCI